VCEPIREAAAVQGRHRGAAAKGRLNRLIRELLATADVAVAVDTIGNFVR
jgi:hypothetical protein